MENLETNKEKILSWHKPVVNRLSVSLDTLSAPGSGNDLSNGTNPSPCI